MALWVAGGLFLAYLILKLRVSLAPGNAHRREARKAIAGSKRRARDRSKPATERAAAWLEAAETALKGLERPDLAASYALRAERLQPDDRQAVSLLALAMRRGSRLRALEKLLWRRLDSHAPGSEAHAEAFAQLLDLYEGPMGVPERARVLRQLGS